MDPVRWSCLIPLLGTLFALGEARPKHPWIKDVRSMTVSRGRAHDNGHKQENNFYYPDMEYFEREDSSSDSDWDNSDYIDSSGDGAGWADDEDMSRDNRIGQIGRGVEDRGWRDHGGEGRWRDEGLQSGGSQDSRRPPEFPYLYELEEGDFGNELHDIDKTDELRQRVAEMQEQLEEMQKVLKRLRKNKRTRDHQRG